MASNSKDVLVYNFLKFLNTEVNSPELSEDAKESIEVAKQCLETAYGFQDPRPDLDLPIELDQLIAGAHPRKEATAEMKAQAEIFKNDGNDFMKKEKFLDAVNSYTKAIELDPNNPVYYSNRAAAYNKLEKFQEAIDDCDEAIVLNPDYSKAYGRKGLALSSLNDHNGAIAMYERAIELDPNNENFRTNLSIAREKASSAPPGSGPPGGLGALFGGQGMPDIGSLLSNPATMDWVSQMMQNPAMVQMASNLMNNMQQPAGSGSNEPPTDGESNTAPIPGPGGINMSTFLAAGQQFARQMQETNPELVERLRNQAGNARDNSQSPPDNGS